MRQGKNLVSNSDFNRKRGEEYLKSSYGRFADGSNASVLISSSFTSENIVGGGQLRSTKVNASSRSIKGKRAYAHFKGGEGNYASLMSSDFAGTETMLNPDHIVGGGAKSIWIRLQRKDATKVASHLFKKRKGASHYLGRCVATSVGLFRRNLDVSFMRMSLPLIHEMTFRREVQA